LRRKRVRTLTVQEKKPMVMRLMGSKRTLMMGLTILLRRNQTMAAVRRMLSCG